MVILDVISQDMILIGLGNLLFKLFILKLRELKLNCKKLMIEMELQCSWICILIANSLVLSPTVVYSHKNVDNTLQF